jgi:hypothetical protein
MNPLCNLEMFLSHLEYVSKSCSSEGMSSLKEAYNRHQSLGGDVPLAVQVILSEVKRVVEAQVWDKTLSSKIEKVRRELGFPKGQF